MHEGYHINIYIHTFIIIPGLAFPTEVKSSGDAVVDATLDTYRAAMKVVTTYLNTKHIYISVTLPAI